MQKVKIYRGIGILIVLLTIILDQITKHAILKMIKSPSQCLEITSFFDLILTWNKGISFSMFNSYGDVGTVILIIVSLVIALGLTVWLFRATSLCLICGLGLIIGGALGNVIDRFRFKAVVDFLYFHLDTFSWPAFNIADTAITIGVVFILFESFFVKKGERRV